MDRGRLLILADDLTGALDSGVQLAHRGQRVVILTAPDVPFPDSSVYDVLVIDTETRHILRLPQERKKRDHLTMISYSSATRIRTWE